jgi:hypothetical protein
MNTLKRYGTSTGSLGSLSGSKFLRKIERKLRRPVKAAVMVATGAALVGPLLALSPPSLAWANVKTTDKGRPGSRQRAKYQRRVKLAQQVSAGTAAIATIALAPTIAPGLTAIKTGVGVAATAASLYDRTQAKDQSQNQNALSPVETPRDPRNEPSLMSQLPTWLLPVAGVALAFLI